MPNVTYIHPDGTTATHEISIGVTVKDGAVDNDVDGIVAECGGNLMCATCHVYVQSPWDIALPTPSDEEQDMLEEVASTRRPTSRLSCQLEVTTALDGLTVQLPERQL